MLSGLAPALLAGLLPAGPFWRTMAGHGIRVPLFNRGAVGIRCGAPQDEAGWRLEAPLQAWKEIG